MANKNKQKKKNQKTTPSQSKKKRQNNTFQKTSQTSQNKNNQKNLKEKNTVIFNEVLKEKEEINYEYFDNAKLKKETKIKEQKKNPKAKRINAIKQKENKKETKTIKKKRKLKAKYKKYLSILFFLVCSSIFLFSTYKLFFFKKELNEIVEEKESILEEFVEPPEKYEEVSEEEKIEDMKIDFQKLKQTNKDLVGWMVFNNKYVNNPVVQTSDNEYYLNHSFKNKVNSVGAIFMDYRNTSWDDKNVVLFGHQTPNNTMFGSLSDVFKKDFFDTENADIIYIFDTEHNLRKYQIFSYYVIETEEYYITTSFRSTEEYKEFLKTIKSRSFKNRGINVTENDKILTLSTCAGTHGTTKRRVIHAKLITKTNE